ncbi:hypothetical protein GCM10028805_47190 [Spirosoma harenae]
MIDTHFVDRLRQQADIVTLIGELMTLKKVGSNYKGCCPFHNENTPSFTVSPKKQIYKCYGCGQAGDVYKFVMAFKRMNFSEAVHYVAGRCNETVLYESRPDRPKSRFHDLRI